MKFDMHCHTKEGSIDAKVSLENYVKKLVSQGFDGMLITDHNSYRGYNQWETLRLKLKTSKPFTVLKGIEYDTRNGGHFLAILPDEVNCKLLELRGLTVAELEKLVHNLGGILGPAHPYGTGFFAFMHTPFGKKNKDLMERFDFIETFNSCTHPKDNQKALELAQKLHLPHFAGSDSHRKAAIGTAFTEFQEKIQNNNDLIRLVRESKNNPAEKKVQTHDRLLTSVYLHTNIIIKELGILGYYLYNKLGAALKTPARYMEKRRYTHLS